MSNNLQFIRQVVSNLKPGEWIDIDMNLFDWRVPFLMSEFTHADWVLEGIVGAAYGWSYTIDGFNHIVRFSRSLDAETRTYTSPDRRDRLKG